jgi:hypothetical protein
MSWIAQRSSIIKEYPKCRKCGEKTTDIDQAMIIIGVDVDNGRVMNSFYSQHKLCPSSKIIKTFTKIKE